MKTSSYFTPKIKKALHKFFDKSSVSHLAKATGFALRKARKITAYNFVAGFLLCCSNGVNTYSEWARQIERLSGKTVKKQSLWERIHAGTVCFVRTLLEKLLVKQAFKGVKTQLFQCFKRVLVQDSTTLHLPDCLAHLFPGPVVRGVQRATARIQSLIDVKRMQFLEFGLGAYTQNDQSASADMLHVVKKGICSSGTWGIFLCRSLKSSKPPRWTFSLAFALE
jgi:hypothetical protein